MGERPPAYFTNFGPRDGPLLGREDPPALGVFVDPAAGGLPVGIAFPIGLVVGRKGPVKTFRLMIGKEELEGRWICDRRAFVRLGESAEEL